LFRWSSVLLVFLIVGILLVGKDQSEEKIIAVASIEQDALDNKINTLLNDERLSGATAAVSVRNAAGEIIYSHLGDTRVHPASVMKLLTGAAALETLGQAHRLKTELHTDGVIEKGVLNGNLYLKGQGDPTLKKEDLDAFSVQLKEKGIREVNGNIYADDNWYDNVRLSQDLNWSDEPYHTGAQVSALTISPNNDFDAGTIIVDVSPSSRKNEAADVGMIPANDYIKIVNKTKTVEQDGSKNILVERKHGTNTVVVSGTLPVNSNKVRTWVSIWEPTDFTLHLFKKSLYKVGISFTSKPKIEHRVLPKDSTVLTFRESMTLEELFIPFMKLSNNGHGEILVKEMGRVIGGEGSWDAGLAVTEGTLTGFGMNPETLLLRDGSGMSHKNLVTANEVTNLLYIAQAKQWFPAFKKSLPVAGLEDRLIGGTLRNRMKGTPAEGKVLAKTGTLNGVTSLAGYVEATNGETYSFSVIVNNHLDNSVTTVIDEIAVAIVSSMK